MSILFVRRRNLGRGSIRGLRSYLSSNSVTSAVWRTWLENTPDLTQLQTLTMVIRWGCTAPVGLGSVTTLNQSGAIHRVNNKKQFRLLCQEESTTLVPRTVFHTSSTEATFPLVVRTATHSRGRNLWVVNNLEELVQVTNQLDDWYASEFIDKVAEYRVYVVNGKVATVAKKTPADPSQVAWNVAQGGRFDVVRWNDWPLQVIDNAIKTFKLSGLDFGGVDVMVDREGKAYTVEINSAPSLPALSDGSVSYRQKCMAKCFQYILENGNDWMDTTIINRWQDVIHPAVVN